MAKAKQEMDQFEAFRLKVIENELIARFNKSEYDKMYYYMEAKRISPEFLEIARKDEEEKQAMYADVENQIKEQVEAQNAETA